MYIKKLKGLTTVFCCYYNIILHTVRRIRVRDCAINLFPVRQIMIFIPVESTLRFSKGLNIIFFSQYALVLCVPIIIYYRIILLCLST